VNKKQDTSAEIIAACQEAIALKPDVAEFHFAMGNAYNELEQYVEAIAAYERCIALEPDYASAYFSIGLSYFVLKQYPESLAAHKKYLSIDPTGENADISHKVISLIENQDKPK